MRLSNGSSLNSPRACRTRIRDMKNPGSVETPGQGHWLRWRCMSCSDIDSGYTYCK